MSFKFSNTTSVVSTSSTNSSQWPGGMVIIIYRIWLGKGAIKNEKIGFFYLKFLFWGTNSVLCNLCKCQNSSSLKLSQAFSQKAFPKVLSKALSKALLLEPKKEGKVRRVKTIHDNLYYLQSLHTVYITQQDSTLYYGTFQLIHSHYS